MWVATHDLPRTAAHPFYTRLNPITESQCKTGRRPDDTGKGDSQPHPRGIPKGIHYSVLSRRTYADTSLRQVPRQRLLGWDDHSFGCGVLASSC